MPDMIMNKNDDVERPEEENKFVASSAEDRKPAAKPSFGISDARLPSARALEGRPSSISGSSSSRSGKRKEMPDSAEKAPKKVKTVASKSASASRGKTSAAKGSSSSRGKPPSSPHSSPETKKKQKTNKTSLSVKPGLAHFPTRRKGFIDDSEVPEHETAEEKKRRLNRNNERRKRARRVFKIDHFTEEQKKLSTANAKLKKDNEVLRERIAALRESLQAGGGPGRFAAVAAAAQALQDQARDNAKAEVATTAVTVDDNPSSRPLPSRPEAVFKQEPSSTPNSLHPASPQDVRPPDQSSPTLFPSPGSSESIPPSAGVLGPPQRERAVQGAIQQLQGRASTTTGAQLSSSLGHLGTSSLNTTPSVLARLQQQQLLMQQLQQQSSTDPLSGLLRLRQQERLEIQRELLRQEIREQDLLGAAAGLGVAAHLSLAAPSPSLSLGHVQELLSNSSANNASAATLQRFLELSRGGINHRPLSPSTAASLVGSQRSTSPLAASQQPAASTTNSLLLAQLQQQLSGAGSTTALRQSLPGTNVGFMSLQNMPFNATSAAQLMHASYSASLTNNLSTLSANPFAGSTSRFFGQGSSIGSGGLDRPTRGTGTGASFLRPAPSAEEAALLFNLARNHTSGTQQQPPQLSNPFQGGDSKVVDPMDDEEEGKTSNSRDNPSREDSGDKEL